MSVNEINLISLRTFYLIRNLRHSFTDQRQTGEDDGLKIIVSPDIPLYLSALQSRCLSSNVLSKTLLNKFRERQFLSVVNV